jgi:hypothetical protein
LLSEWRKWWSTCLARRRPWVQAPLPKKLFTLFIMIKIVVLLQGGIVKHRWGKLKNPKHVSSVSTKVYFRSAGKWIWSSLSREGVKTEKWKLF